MPTDRELADLCAASYQDSTAWDRLFREGDGNPTQVAIKDNVVVFRGSVTTLDWIDDIKAIPVDNHYAGLVEKGFNDGLEKLYPQILQSLGDDPIVCGHSLGAARALIFAAMLATAGRKPARVVGFGAPRPGFRTLTTILANVPGAIYRNRFDPVTEVPIPFLTAPWQHPYAITPIDIPPDRLAADTSPWVDFEDAISKTIFADHHIELYQMGVPD